MVLQSVSGATVTGVQQAETKCKERIDEKRAQGWLRRKVYVCIHPSIHPTFLYHKQGSAKRWSPVLVIFFTAHAYHFYLTLPTAFTQPGDHLSAEPCTCESVLVLSVQCQFSSLTFGLRCRAAAIWGDRNKRMGFERGREMEVGGLAG